jgi:hypothetical protein
MVYSLFDEKKKIDKNSNIFFLFYEGDDDGQCAVQWFLLCAFLFLFSLFIAFCQLFLIN